jgi:hypothetical protein
MGEMERPGVKEKIRILPVGNSIKVRSIGTSEASIEAFKASEGRVLSREAPLALPVEGLLKPRDCATQAPMIAGTPGGEGEDKDITSWE